MGVLLCKILDVDKAIQSSEQPSIRYLIITPYLGKHREVKSPVQGHTVSHGRVNTRSQTARLWSWRQQWQTILRSPLLFLQTLMWYIIVSILKKAHWVAEGEGLFPGHRPAMSQLRDSPGPKPHFCHVSRGWSNQKWVGRELGGKNKIIQPAQIQRTKWICPLPNQFGFSHEQLKFFNRKFVS